MPKRIPLEGIIVSRDGRSFMPPIGQPFDFTKEELDDIAEVNPGAVKRVEIAADDSDYLSSDSTKTESNAADRIAAAKAAAAERAKQAEANKQPPGDADL